MTETVTNQYVDNSAMDGSQHRVNILLVDDQPGKMIAHEAILAELGQNIIKATNGREAIASFCEDPGKFCAVLLDLTMPEMGGTETFAELRRLNPTVKVVLMSGFPEQDAVARFRSNDLAGFVPKPFTPEELRERFRVIFPEAAESPESTHLSSPGDASNLVASARPPLRTSPRPAESAALSDAQRANGSAAIGSPQ